MDIIACGTTDFQRLARATQRGRWARCALALVRAALVLAVLVPSVLALARGWAHLAAAELASTMLATGLAWLGNTASLAKRGWAGLRKHCLILTRRASAGRAIARIRAMAREMDCVYHIARRQLDLILFATLVIIGNRLLPSVCISPRVLSQRPN